MHALVRLYSEVHGTREVWVREHRASVASAAAAPIRRAVRCARKEIGPGDESFSSAQGLCIASLHRLRKLVRETCFFARTKIPYLTADKGLQSEGNKPPLTTFDHLRGVTSTLSARHRTVCHAPFLTSALSSPRPATFGPAPAPSIFAKPKRGIGRVRGVCE